MVRAEIMERQKEISKTPALDRIAEVDGAMNAWLHVDASGALAAADAIDARRAAGEALGALAGLPVGVKDMICTRGLPTTAASSRAGASCSVTCGSA